MQQITITGYLSRDAEQATTQGGDTVTRWNIPVKQGFGEREQTNWFRVSIWGKRADYAARARKGDFASVTGELTIGEYNGKPQYEIRAADFACVSSAPKDDAPRGGGNGYQQQGGTAAGGNADLDDDIPFVTRDGIY